MSDQLDDIMHFIEEEIRREHGRVDDYGVVHFPEKEWSNMEKCGCTVTKAIRHYHPVDLINYCPLHAAAPQMLEALKKTMAIPSSMEITGTIHQLTLYNDALKAVGEAIALAEPTASQEDWG
jgi:hypothetical protein